MEKKKMNDELLMEVIEECVERCEEEYPNEVYGDCVEKMKKLNSGGAKFYPKPKLIGHQNLEFIKQKGVLWQQSNSRDQNGEENTL